MKHLARKYTAAKPGKRVTECGKMVLSHRATIERSKVTCEDCNAGRLAHKEAS